MKLENADKERLSPCANLRYTNVLLAKLMQGVRLIAGQPFEGSDMPGNNQVCRTSFSQPYAVLHPLVC